MRKRRRRKQIRKQTSRGFGNLLQKGFKCGTTGIKNFYELTSKKCQRVKQFKKFPIIAKVLSQSEK